MGRLALALVLSWLGVVGVDAHGQAEPLEELIERVAPFPRHPAFPDPISADSPNAAGRYLWFHQSVGRDTLSPAGVIGVDLTQWRVPEELWGDLGYEAPDVQAWRLWLGEHKALTDSLVEATRLRHFDPHWNVDLRSVFSVEDDPRKDLRSACSRISYVLRDDAIRLWLEGENKASIDRMEAMVRIGLQLGNGRADVMMSVIAGELVERGLKLVREAYHADITDAEADRLLGICKLVPSHDPVSIRETWYRNFEIQRQFVEIQLETEGGGEALWFRIGELIDADGWLERAMKWIREGEHEEPPFFSELGHGITIEDAVRGLDERFAEVTHASMVESYNSIWSYAYEVYTNWDDPKIRSRAIWADDLVKEDPSRIPYLMALTVLDPWQASQDVINARNATIATYAGADPLP